MSKFSGWIRMWVGLTAAVALLAGCGGSSSGSTSSLPSGNGGGGGSTIQGIATPTSVAVVTATHAS
jgi:hypothetical protein